MSVTVRGKRSKGQGQKLGLAGKQKQEDLSELEANWSTQQAPGLLNNETLFQKQQQEESPRTSLAI